MKPNHVCAAAALLLAACAGDNHTSQQSPGQPARSANSREVQLPGGRTRFAENRIYRIERFETAEVRRGEWRALGATIRQNGSSIEFTELGTGRSISFTSPHQVIATNSKSDRVATQGPSEEPGQGRTELPDADVGNR